MLKLSTILTTHSIFKLWVISGVYGECTAVIGNVHVFYSYVANFYLLCKR